MKTKLPFYTEEEILWLATCDGIGQREKRKTLAAIQARHVTETAGLVEALEAMVGAGEYSINLIHATADPKSMEPVDWKGVALHMYASLNVITKARAALAAAKQS